MGAVGGNKANAPLWNMAQYCFDHVEEELKLYCETCGELVCLQCVLQGGKHHNHDYALLKVAFEKYKKEITSSLEPMEKQVVIIEKALAELKTRCGEISDQRAAIEDNIHVTFRRLREVLTIRETELIRQLHQMTQAKLKGLADQSDQIETILAKINSCLHFMGESLRTANESDVLMMKANTVQHVKELTTPFQQDMLNPNTEADMIFSALADMTAMCQDYGQMHESDRSSNYQDTDITVGEKSTATQHTSRRTQFSVTCDTKTDILPASSNEHRTTNQTYFNSLMHSLVVGSKRIEQTYSWDAAGLCLYYPKGPLLDKDNGKTIKLEATISGSYHFPPNTKPVSAIYSITTDISIEATLELEHCYRGNKKDLAFVYCLSHQPPFDFILATKEKYKYSFTAKNGVIKTQHFSHWAIVVLVDWFDKARSWLGFRDDIILNIIPFYQVEVSHVKVDLVIVRGLSAHVKVRGHESDTSNALC